MRFVAIAIILFSAVLCREAFANDQRCNAPPYGMSTPKFKLFVETFGHLIVPTKTLPALCNAKYGGADRTGLYNLGFTDQDIDSTDMDDLSVDFLSALKKFADKIR